MRKLISTLMILAVVLSLIVACEKKTITNNPAVINSTIPSKTDSSDIKDFYVSRRKNGNIIIHSPVFEEEDNIVNLEIPSEYEGRKVDGMHDVNYYKNLKTIYIPKTVKRIYSEDEVGYYFDDLRNLEKFIVDPDNKWYGSVDEMLYRKEDGKLLRCPMNINKEKLVIPEVIKCFNKGAMLGCKNIKIVIIKNNVENLSDAFVCMDNLRKVSIAGSVRIISDEAFYRNTKLKVVKLHKGTRVIGRDSFLSCSELSKINIPKTVRLIKKHAFNKCYNLKKVKVPKTCKIANNAFPKTCRIIRK